MRMGTTVGADAGKSSDHGRVGAQCLWPLSRQHSNEAKKDGHESTVESSSTQKLSVQRESTACVLHGYHRTIVSRQSGSPPHHLGASDDMCETTTRVVVSNNTLHGGLSRALAQYAVLRSVSHTSSRKTPRAERSVLPRLTHNRDDLTTNNLDSKSCCGLPSHLHARPSSLLGVSVASTHCLQRYSMAQAMPSC